MRPRIHQPRNTDKVAQAEHTAEKNAAMRKESELQVREQLGDDGSKNEQSDWTTLAFVGAIAICTAIALHR